MPDTDTNTAPAWTDQRPRPPARGCDDTIEITDDMLMELDRDIDLDGQRRPPPWNRLTGR
jgi:hypothetical protein